MTVTQVLDWVSEAASVSVWAAVSVYKISD
jgi:hypothetical protein